MTSSLSPQNGLHNKLRRRFTSSSIASTWPMSLKVGPLVPGINYTRVRGCTQSPVLTNILPPVCEVITFRIRSHAIDFSRYSVSVLGGTPSQFVQLQSPPLLTLTPTLTFTFPRPADSSPYLWFSLQFQVPPKIAGKANPQSITTSVPKSHNMHLLKNPTC